MSPRLWLCGVLCSVVAAQSALPSAPYPLESVLLVAPFIPGHLAPIVRLARELAAAGHPVTLLTHESPMATSFASDTSFTVRVWSEPLTL